MAEAGPGTLVPVRPESELPNEVEPTPHQWWAFFHLKAKSRARPAFNLGLLSRQVHIPSRYVLTPSSD